MNLTIIALNKMIPYNRLNILFYIIYSMFIFMFRILIHEETLHGNVNIANNPIKNITAQIKRKVLGNSNTIISLLCRASNKCIANAVYSTETFSLL